MASNRENLFAQIKLDLEGINGASPYSNRVSFVSRDIMTWDQCGTRPAVVMVEEDESDQVAASLSRRFTEARLGLVVYDNFRGSRYESRAEQENAWLADLQYAMISGTNRHHTNTAITTKYLGMDKLPMDSQEAVSLIASFELRYHWDFANPQNV